MKESLKHFLTKSKRFLLSRDFALAVVFVLMGTACFGLGRLSVAQNNKAPVSVVYPGSLNSEGQGNTAVSVSKRPAAAVAATDPSISNPAESSEVVASKNGTKYHYPWCPGAKQISEQNKIYFTSPAEAEKAGFEKASNCKGL